MLEAPLEKLACSQVAFAVFSFDARQQRIDFLFRKRQDALADFGGAFLGVRHERTDQYARWIGAQNQAGSLNGDRFDGHAAGWLKTVTAFCMIRISARESRKARVDSAPWLPLTRSTCRASRQPPVLEE